MLLNKKRLKSTFAVGTVLAVCSYGISQELGVSLNESNKCQRNADFHTLKERLINPLWAERFDCESRRNAIL